MIPVDIFTADRLAVALHGRYDTARDLVVPGIAPSQPIITSLFRKQRELLFDDERAAKRCACGHLGPPFDPTQLCLDCEVEEAEIEAWRRFCRWLREWESNPYWMLLVHACAPLVKDPRREFWRLRWQRTCWKNPAAVPWEIVAGSESPDTRDGVALSYRELPDALAGRDERQRPVVDQRVLAERVHYHLGIATPLTRVYDPTTAANLAGVPRKVATAIARLCREYDRQTLRSLRTMNHEFRQVAKPLGDTRVTATATAILLRHGKRSYQLLRHAKDPPTRNLSPGTGRSAGCRLQLLGESERGLRREIAHFRRTGRLRRSACRFTGANPYEKHAPEDFLTLAQCLLGAPPPRKPPLGTPPVPTKKRKKRRRRRSD